MDFSRPALDVVGVGPQLLAIKTHEVAVDVHVHLELRTVEGLVDNAFLASLLEVLANPDKRELVTSFRVEGETSTLTCSESNVGSCVSFQTPCHAHNGTEVERSLRWIAELVLA